MIKEILGGGLLVIGGLVLGVVGIIFVIYKIVKGTPLEMIFGDLPDWFKRK